MSTILLNTLALAIFYVVLVWLLSLKMGRCGIIDAFWGPGFVLISWLAFLNSGIASSDRLDLIFLLVMVTLWGMRLGIHLSIRVFSDPHEDRRYAAMRDKYQPHWWLKSLGIVFLLQGLIMWFVAWPVTTAFAGGDGKSLAILGSVGIFLWGTGLFFETVGDLQLARFRADERNKGKVLNTGLWGMTRHPNYFGDFAVWWGLWMFSVSCGAPLWTIVSPAVMGFFLMKVSGVTLLEKDIAERRPGYADYIRSTNAFFPGPKRRGK